MFSKYIVNGIKGYVERKIKCKKLGRKVKRTAKEKMEERYRKKLLARSNWFKGGKKGDYYVKDPMVSNKKPMKIEEFREQKTVLFVEHTRNGELGAKLREVIGRLAPLLGVSIEVVERSGSSFL